MRFQRQAKNSKIDIWIPHIDPKQTYKEKPPSGGSCISGFVI
jgi:hypothetical protein